MGVKRLFWCSLLAGAAFLMGCGNQSDGDGSDSSVSVDQLDNHVGVYCSGNGESNQATLNSDGDIGLGDGLHIRVFGELKESVQVHWQLCAVPSVTLDHELTGKAKTGETAVRYWVVKKSETGTDTRINISEYLVPGSRLEIYSKKDPNTFFLRVKGGGKKSTFATSIKDLDSDQARSVAAISKEDADLEGEVSLDEDTIQDLFGDDRLENVISDDFTKTGKKFKRFGATAVNTVADVGTHAVSAVGDFVVALLDGLGDIAVAGTDMFVSVGKVAIDGVELGVDELGNLIKKAGKAKGGKAKGGNSNSAIIEQICAAVNPKLVKVINKFCDFNKFKANSQSMQTCQVTMQNLLKQVKKQNNIEIPYSSHYCTVYGHATVEFCQAIVQAITPEGGDASTQMPSGKITNNLLQACQTL